MGGEEQAPVRSRRRKNLGVDRKRVDASTECEDRSPTESWANGSLSLSTNQGPRLSIFWVGLFFVYLASWNLASKVSQQYGHVPPEELPLNPETQAFLIVAEGPAAIGTQLQQWAYSYSTNPNYFDMASRLRYYQSGTDFLVDIYYLDIRLVAFMANERYVDHSVREDPVLKNQSRGFEQFPMTTTPLVFPYRILVGDVFLPYIATSRLNESIVLSVDILAQMYLGEVTYWNDTKIQELNPVHAQFLPGIPVIPMGYVGRESSTFYLTQTFSRLSKSWKKAFPEGPLTDWPVNLNMTVADSRLNPNMRFYSNAYGPFANVQDINGSIAYTGFPLYRWAGGGNTPYALIEHNGIVQEPTYDSTLALYQNTSINGNNIVVDIDYEADGWPFSYVDYVIVNERNEVSEPNCHKDGELLKFFRWVLLTQSPQVAARANGFYMLPSHISKEVIKRMEQVECYGEQQPLLALQVVDDHDQGYFPALLAVNFVLAGISCSLIVYLAVTSDSDGNRPNIVTSIYNILLVSGALSVYVSIVFFYLVPEHTWICQLRQWLLGEGFSLFLGSMFGRTLLMHRIWKFANSKHKRLISDKERKWLSIRDFIIVIMVTVVLQGVILILWTSIDTLSATLSVLDDISRQASWVCKSDRVWLWIGIEIGFFAVMLGGGLYVVFRTWDMKDKFTEGKWLLMSIYNMVVVIAAFVPLFIILVIKDDNLYIFVVTGVDFIVTSTLIAICISRVGLRLERFVMRLRGSLGMRTGTTTFDASSMSKSVVTESKRQTRTTHSISDSAGRSQSGDNHA